MKRSMVDYFKNKNVTEAAEETRLLLDMRKVERNR